MSREDIDAARRFFEELNPLLAGNESLLDLAERYTYPESVAELGRMEGTVTGGAEGMARYLEGQRAVIENMRIDPEEFIEVGDRIVMPFRLHGTAKETGLPIEFRYAQVFEMRDGRFLHTRMYRSKETAVAAASGTR